MVRRVHVLLLSLIGCGAQNVTGPDPPAADFQQLSSFPLPYNRYGGSPSTRVPLPTALASPPEGPSQPIQNYTSHPMPWSNLTGASNIARNQTKRVFSLAGGDETTVLLNLKDLFINFDTVYTAANWTGWTNSSGVCTWSGISCIQGKVTNVTLQANGWTDEQGLLSPYEDKAVHMSLLGQVDSVLLQLTKLPELRYIQLAYNGLSGTLPGAEFSQGAQKLQWLILYSNEIEGSIPSGTTWSLPELTVFSISFNRDVSGPLPMDWGADGKGFQKLRRFAADKIALNGALPRDWPRKLPALKQLVCYDSWLMGPLPAIWHRWNLTELDLGRNNITGTLPVSWGTNGSLPLLTRLDLEGNHLEGTLPSAWGSEGALKSLQTLRLYGNNFTGTIPATWAASNASTGNASPMSNSTRRFPALQRLRLGPGNALLCGDTRGLPVYGSSPLNVISSLGSCLLSANGSLSQGEASVLMQLVPLLPGLLTPPDNTTVIVGWNQTTDICLWSYTDCDRDGRLSTLEVRNMGLKGAVSDVLGVLVQLPRLTTVVLTGNALYGTLPSGRNFSDQAQQLQVLQLSRNAITGPLPSAADWDLPSIFALSLSHNPLGGTLPSDWGSNSSSPGTTMGSLSSLRLRNCSLTGTLPTTWGSQLSTLQHIELDDNSLTGTLPPQWSNMSSLARLYLNNNHNLTGTLPGEWGDGLGPDGRASNSSLVLLEKLSIANASLTGSLPAAWGRDYGMVFLFTLNLAGNNLSGTIPGNYSTFQDANGTQSQTFPLLERFDLFPGNKGLCGALPANLSVYEEAWSSPFNYTVLNSLYGFVDSTPTGSQNVTLSTLQPCPVAQPA